MQVERGHSHKNTKNDQNCATKLLRLIVQTKSKYKPKNDTTSKEDEEPEMPKDKDNENTPEKYTEDESQQDSKIRIVMYLSRKKLMKKLMPPKMKKIG